MNSAHVCHICSQDGQAHAQVVVAVVEDDRLPHMPAYSEQAPGYITATADDAAQRAA
jgi:hypothetical protein